MRDLSDPEDVDEAGTVERMRIAIDHMPFAVGRPKKLKKGDPRRSPEKGTETWVIPVVFQKRPGSNVGFSPDVMFYLDRRAKVGRLLDQATRERMDRLAKATALRLMAEDMGLKWLDNSGFRHGRTDIQVEVGFEPMGSPQ